MHITKWRCPLSDFTKLFSPKACDRFSACNKDDDCPFQQFCFDISEELLKNARKRGYTQFYDTVLTLLNIKTKECSRRFSDFMVSDFDNYMFVLRDAFAKLDVVVKKTKQVSGMRGWIERIETTVFKRINFTEHVEKPLAAIRQGYSKLQVSYN